MNDFRHIASIDEFRALALARLPRFVADYIERGAGDGGGVRRNVDAFRDYTIVPRALIDVSPVDAAVTLFGRTYASTFGISAVGGGGAYRRFADTMLAEAAAAANLPFILSNHSSCSIEAVAKVAAGHTWFQLYASKRPDITERMLRRVHDLGIEVLVFTVDFSVPPRSEIAHRTGISLYAPPEPRALPHIAIEAAKHPRWAIDMLLQGGGLPLGNWTAYAARPGNAGARQLLMTAGIANSLWSDVDRLRQLWPGKLVIKGLVHPKDVVRAAAAGADAVTVSNHGGNKLDCMPAALDSLLAVRSGYPAGIPVLFDGGVRRGSDMLIARALGADFCFVGRPTLYGVIAGGRAGARRALEILADGLTHTMAMAGCRTIADIGPCCLAATTQAGERCALPIS